MVRSEPCMSFMHSIRRAISSLPRGLISCVRSPWAMAWVWASARFKGPVTEAMVRPISGRKMMPGDNSSTHSDRMALLALLLTLARRAWASFSMSRLSLATMVSTASPSARWGSLD